MRIFKNSFFFAFFLCAPFTAISSPSDKVVFEKYGEQSVLTGPIAKIRGYRGLYYGILEDSTVISWTDDGLRTEMDSLKGVADISVNELGVAFLSSDGTVQADFLENWENSYSNFGDRVLINELSDVIAISVGWETFKVVKEDGSVIGWGDAQYNTNIPNNLSGAKKVSSGIHVAMALLEDNTAVIWGEVPNNNDLRNFIENIGSDVIDVLAGDHSYELVHEDGTISSYGGKFANFNLSNVKRIESSRFGGELILTQDGKILRWDANRDKIVEIANISNAVDIALPAAVLTSDGRVISNIDKPMAEIPTSVGPVLNFEIKESQITYYDIRGKIVPKVSIANGHYRLPSQRLIFNK